MPTGAKIHIRERRMAGSSTRFDSFIAEEVEKHQGNLVPVKAGLPERILVRRVSCRRLHPNPYDEFAIPSVGPNYGIISDYVHKLKEAARHGDASYAWDDPILVEKMYPKDYLILNGHHRWAAAINLGMKRVRIRVVNLTQETDIRTMIKNSQHDMRVTMDFDEAVLHDGGDEPEEKALPFPFRNIYKERLRQGIPALFHFLSVNGFDIWVYTKKYYSQEYIQKLFRKYHVHINGVVTGIVRTKKQDSEARERVRKLFDNTYKMTLHIDRQDITLTHTDSKEFEQFSLSGEGAAWSREVMNLISEIKKR